MWDRSHHPHASSSGEKVEPTIARFWEIWGREWESSVSKESPHSLDENSVLTEEGGKDSIWLFLVREKTTYRVVLTVLDWFSQMFSTGQCWGGQNHPSPQLCAGAAVGTTTCAISGTLTWPVEVQWPSPFYRGKNLAGRLWFAPSHKASKCRVWDQTPHLSDGSYHPAS